ncbi:MAG: light-harvesting antenna LH1, beta subunit [Steroidobacteraceae bacterium]|jgi:light-harvesting complex 1 beta chain
MADNRQSLSGLNAEEAKAFHSAMLQGTGIFIAVTLVAHFLVWNWRPWF